MLAGDTLKLPLIASVPVQPPLAVQALAFVLDQLSVALPPAVKIVAGLAVNVTVGGAGSKKESIGKRVLS